MREKQLVQVTTKSPTKCFSSRQLLYFLRMQQRCFIYTSHFITHSIIKIYTQESRYNQIKSLINECFIKDGLKLFFVYLFSFNCKSWYGIYIDNQYSFVPLPWFTLRRQQFHPPWVFCCCFYHQCKCQHSKKGK